MVWGETETAVGWLNAMENVRLYIDNLNEGNKTLFRRLEKLNYKLIEATHSIRFNKNCLREKLCPRGLTFQLID